MSNQEFVNTIIGEARSQSNPGKNPKGYIDALISKSFDALGNYFDDWMGEDVPNALLDEPMSKVLDFNLDMEDSLIMLDIPSTPFLSYALTKKNSNARFCLVDSQNFYPDNDSFELFSNILEQGISTVSKRFLGTAKSVEEILKMAGKSPISQLSRIVYPTAHQDFMRDIAPSPIILDGDSHWGIGSKLEGRTKNTICLWSELGVNTLGNYIREKNFDREISYDKYLKSIIELPDSYGNWIFSWSDVPQESVTMLDFSHLDTLDEKSLINYESFCASAKIKNINHMELVVNRTYCPHYFLTSVFIKASEKNLKSLSKSIRRGTSLSRKKLGDSIMEDLDDLNDVLQCFEKSDSPLDLYPKRKTATSDNCYYIDNLNVDKESSVTPYRLKIMPEGQTKYIVKPEEGPVILMARNGKNVTLYDADGPTLVSNNNFIIRLDESHVTTEYVYCYLLGNDFKNLIWQKNGLLSKKELDEVTIPIVDKNVQHAIVLRHKENLNELRKARELIEKFEHIDSFDPIEALQLNTQI